MSLPASNTDAKEIQIKHKNLTLNGILKLVDSKTFKDGVVLMVHGTLAHNEMDTIKNLATVLNERGLSTLAINLSLGINNRHGMYDCKVPHRHRHLDALDEIGAWFDWLQAQGVDNVVLFGHSRGGNQAALFAGKRGHKSLRRIVLMAPSLGGGGIPKSYEKTHNRRWGEVMAQAKALVKDGRGAEMLKKVGLLYCKDTSVAARSFISYYDQDPRSDTIGLLSALKIPSLVVAGNNDQVVKELPDRIKPIADGKRIIFATIEDADHFFLDLFAEDVADIMEKFIASNI